MKNRRCIKGNRAKEIKTTKEDFVYQLDARLHLIEKLVH